MKRIICVCLILTLIVTLTLVGCTKKEDTSVTPGTTEAPKITPQPSKDEPLQEPEQGYFKKYDPPITFTQNMSVGPDALWLDGDDVENNPYTEWMEREMGIKWKAAWIAPDWDTNNQKINIAAASNSLPDVIFTNAEIIGKLIKADQVLALDDLISEYASPLVNYLNEDNMASTKEKYFLPYIQGGKIYAYPFPYDNPGLWRVNWIRKDLLDTLGKNVPQTLQEIEDVFSAYKAKYPDGIAMPLNKNLDMTIVMPAFEAYPRMWKIDGSGKLVYGSVQPEVKQGLEVLNRWYKEGYIDREFIAKDNAVEEFTKGNMLAWKGAWWNVHWPFPDFWNNLPEEGDMVVLPVLKGPDGKQGIMVSAVSGLGVAVSKKAENPEALMYLLNESVDSKYRSDKIVLEAMEKVGYTFKYPYTPYQEPINNDDPDKITNAYNYEVEGWGYFNRANYHEKFMLGFQLNAPSGFQNFLQDIVDIYSARKGLEDVIPTTQLEYKQRSEEPRHLPALASAVDYWVHFQTTDGLLVNEFVGSPTPAQVAKKALLDTMENETFAKIIMGTLPLDAFDAFVDDWNKNGGDDWTKEVNEWYQTTK